jgi:hypothetical protein
MNFENHVISLINYQRATIRLDSRPLLKNRDSIYHKKLHSRTIGINAAFFGINELQ